MNQLRVLLLTTLILLSTSRLPGQEPRLTESLPGTPAVCNDGTIAFSVARAHRHVKDFLFGGGRWEIWGWFNVDPGECSAIGPWTVFEPGGGFGKDSVTLLAFAFWDSKGVWRGIKVPGGEGWFYPIYPSDQQICVQRGEFRYTRDGLDQSDLARECARAAAGYILIPASFMYKGSYRSAPLFGEPDHRPDYIHVTIGPDDRAITSGHPIGSAAMSQGLGGGGTPHSEGEASPSLCGKVSCWDLFAQALSQAAAQNSAANAGHNPPPPRASTNLPPSPPPAAAATAPPVDDDDPIGDGGFITPVNSPAPASDLAKSLQWVRDDVVAYVEASKTGFAAYKKGDAQLSQGYRMWDSSVKPSQAKGCWVVQGTTATTFSCLLLERADLNDLRSYYTEVTKDLTASLPRDWKTQAEPPFGGGDLPNQGYRSSSGAHLEVWIARAESGAAYEIHFQLVSAH